MKRSVQGKLASATHSQTETYLKPLFRKLRKKVAFLRITFISVYLFDLLFLKIIVYSLSVFQNLPADIKESITDIIKFMLEREYVKVKIFIYIPIWKTIAVCLVLRRTYTMCCSWAIYGLEYRQNVVINQVVNIESVVLSLLDRTNQLNVKP